MNQIWFVPFLDGLTPETELYQSTRQLTIFRDTPTVTAEQIRQQRLQVLQC